MSHGTKMPDLKVVAVASALLMAGCNAGPRSSPLPDLSALEIVDLTHSFGPETIYWPTAEGFVLEADFEGYTDAGFYYAAHSFRAAEHGGTHLDAPVHFAEGMHAADQIPVERFAGNAVVLDVSEKCLDDVDYQVSVSDILEWESRHGEIADGSILLIRTGFDSFWPDRATYLGTAELGPKAVAGLHFPSLHPETAEWLVENRNLKAIGIDTASIDYGQSQLFQSHQVLFARNIPAFENVAGLGRLPATGSFVIALPMKIEGGSGGPLRIVALVPTSIG
jgi:kynurenine formamidase